jgi:hypothetical protein
VDYGAIAGADGAVLCGRCHHYLFVARLSDHQQRRGLYATIFGIICVVGYGIMISGSSSGAHFFGCFVIAVGLYAIVGIPLSWLPSSKFVDVFSMASPGGSFD